MPAKKKSSSRKSNSEPKTVTAQSVSKTSSSKQKKNYSASSFVRFIDNNFVLIIAAGLIFLLGFFFGSMWTENKMLKSGAGGTAVVGDPTVPGLPDPSAGVTLEAFATINDVDHVQGDPKSKVFIVEYSDLNCGYCKIFHPTMQELVSEFDGKVAWAYRHLPILGSQQQAEAAECAAKLGGNEAFWSFTNGYFETLAGTENTDLESMTGLAGELGLNQAAFAACIESGEMTEVVNAQFQSGQAVGLSATPSSVVVVDGVAKEIIPGALPKAEVQKIIEQYL